MTRRGGEIEVFGFHGTSAGAVRSIITEGFRGSSKEWDWLGDGIYFWQDAPERAWEWGSKNRGYGSDAAVIGARIKLRVESESGKRMCIDLLDIGWNVPLRNMYDFLDKKCKSSGERLPTNHGQSHELDRLVINNLVMMLLDNGVKIEAVRGAFQEGDPTFKGSRLSDKSHVQIAVRDPAIIDEKWRER